MDESDYPGTDPEEQGEPNPEDFPDEVIEEWDESHRKIKIESMTAMVGKMAVSDKIKLALIGNKEARGLLIKESNKVVVKNVLENPRVTDDEVINYAGNKNLSGEVARIISGKKKFLKSFKVRCALVRNPKTPVPQAIKMMPGIKNSAHRDRNKYTIFLFMRQFLHAYRRKVPALVDFILLITDILSLLILPLPQCMHDIHDYESDNSRHNARAENNRADIEPEKPCVE